MRAEIQRQAYTEFGTLGRLRVYHADAVAFTCLTAENPDRGNRPRESCVPEGDYLLRRARYHRGNYDCFQVLLADGSEIPGRSLVKVHVGNTDLDVEGCVVLGNDPVVVRGHWGVGPSGGADGGFTRFMRLMDRLEANDVPLTIYFRKG